MRILRPTLSIVLALAVCLVTFQFGMVAAQQNDRNIRITNGTNIVVVNLYISNSASKAWAEDALGNDVVQPGNSISFNVNDGSGACIFDFAFVLENGQRIERPAVNVCTTTTLTVLRPDAEDKRTVDVCLKGSICTPVQILFGTDRQRLDKPKRIGFGGQRAGALQLGAAVVTVPRAKRNRGQVNRPSWLDRKLGISAEGDPARHFTIPDGGILLFSSTADFVKAMKGTVARAGEFKDHAIVFVHGYNVSFDDALYRASQITYDLGTNDVPFGSMFVYSWPSAGDPSAYGYDEDSARYSVTNLLEFIRIVAHQSNAKRVHVIAHSMGSFALLEALQSLTSTPSKSPVIDQLILAAPDIDAIEFDKIAVKISGLAKGITMYASSKDVAMLAARRFRYGAARAGDITVSGPTVATSVDTIDVSTLSTEIFTLGHAEYADRKELLNDMGLLFRNGDRPPHKRNINYKQQGEGARIYWRYAD